MDSYTGNKINSQRDGDLGIFHTFQSSPQSLGLSLQNFELTVSQFPTFLQFPLYSLVKALIIPFD